MLNRKEIQKVFRRIQVIRPPKSRLATFGASQINYQLVTDVPGLPDRSRLRVGMVTAEKPSIITPQALQEQFLGFGDESRHYAEWMTSHYGEALRGIEYQFRNEPVSTQVELTSPDHLIRELTQEFDQGETFHRALILGTEKLWELSLMKFIVEETLASFAHNMQELSERGFFDKQKDFKRRHREIQNLFQKARSDRSLLPELANKLKGYGLFNQYQDAFFQLVNR